MNTSPEAALVTALAGYLRTAIKAEPDLVQSEVIEAWPEPTESLRLAPNRVVVAVQRIGRGAGQERIGGPLVEKVAVTGSATGTVRWEYGQIDQPLALGLWACRRQLRDDVDLLLAELLNRPMWSTIVPVASTTLSAPIEKLGLQTVPVASLADLWPGVTLEIGSGTALERLVVQDIRPTGIVIAPRRLHAAGVPVVEVAGRRERVAEGLHLRAPMHHGNVATFLFDESALVLDDAEGGRGSQRQEWRSVRNGTGSIRWTRAVTVALQKQLDVVVHASAEGGTVSTPTTRRVFG